MLMVTEVRTVSTNGSLTIACRMLAQGQASALVTMGFVSKFGLSKSACITNTSCDLSFTSSMFIM